MKLATASAAVCAEFRHQRRQLQERRLTAARAEKMEYGETPATVGPITLRERAG